MNGSDYFLGTSQKNFLFTESFSNSIYVQLKICLNGDQPFANFDV